MESFQPLQNSIVAHRFLEMIGQVKLNITTTACAVFFQIIQYRCCDLVYFVDVQFS